MIGKSTKKALQRASIEFARVAGLLLLLVCSAAPAQTVVYYHTDALGTPIAITDASRNVIERSEYEPYGRLLNRPLTDGPGFTGHVTDGATGLSYMQQRYYDPQLGRFLSVDPVTVNSSTGANFNRYWYANNNPYRHVDPDGRDPSSIAMGYAKMQELRRTDPQEAARVERVGLSILGIGAALGGGGYLAYVALMNPAVATELTITVGELAAGDAIGPGTLAATAALASRAEEIHGVLDTIAQSRRTTAVLDTAEGVKVVASSEKNLTPAQRAMLGADEVAASGQGHAEVTAVNAATEMGLTPTAVGASREVCADCRQVLDERNIRH